MFLYIHIYVQRERERSDIYLESMRENRAEGFLEREQGFEREMVRAYIRLMQLISKVVIILISCTPLLKYDK